VTDLGEDGLEILYTSPRRLCVLLRGLVEGTGRIYDETIHVEEPECMHRGDAACRVVLTFP
jgi:predicted hydrocarbon binding protein